MRTNGHHGTSDAKGVASRTFRRFRDADATNHARALAYQSSFVIISGFIGMVGLASVLDIEALRRTVVEMSKTLAPGPAGRLLEDAASQGASGGARAMVLGLGSALIGMTFAMAQVERSGNRIAGRNEDRPAGRRYGVAAVLALTAGVAMALGALVLAGGESIARGFGWDEAATLWSVVRWPLGVALLGIAVYVLFRVAPDGPIASPRGLMAGTVVALVLWVVFTLGLAIYFSVSSGSEQTYGSLVTVIALLLWAGATSTALHVGLAVAAAWEPGAGADGVVSVPEAGASIAGDRGRVSRR